MSEGKRITAAAFDPPLDPGIARAVILLIENGWEPFESCEGGPGHGHPEPTVCFHGDRSEGMRGLAVLMQSGLPVKAMRRTWPIVDGEPTGPHWEVAFYRKLTDPS